MMQECAEVGGSQVGSGREGRSLWFEFLAPTKVFFFFFSFVFFWCIRVPFLVPMVCSAPDGYSMVVLVGPGKARNHDGINKNGNRDEAPLGSLPGRSLPGHTGHSQALHMK